MDEYVIKQKIQKAFVEPKAPEGLVEKVILRANAVTMGVNAQKALETAPAEKMGELAARALIGQLAAVSELPAGVAPEHLAQQLEQAPVFVDALRGGNVARRVANGELMRQVIGQAPVVEQADPQISVPQKEGPAR